MPQSQKLDDREATIITRNDTQTFTAYPFYVLNQYGETKWTPFSDMAFYKGLREAFPSMTSQKSLYKDVRFAEELTFGAYDNALLKMIFAEE